MTTDSLTPVINLDDVVLRDFGDPEGRFSARVGSFGKVIGSSGIGCMLHVVEPGRKAFPFHAHHRIHEVFVVLEGEGVYRFGDERYPIRTGDVCAAPTGGADMAHQIVNTGTTVLKYLGLSTTAETEVVEYPDSGKFAVSSRYDMSNPEAGGIRFVGRKEASLDYFEGEP